MARALQQSLLPPSPTEIPGLEPAARYRAARDDVMEGLLERMYLRHNATNWVCHRRRVRPRHPRHGQDALAHHTLRTAAMFERRPGRVLRFLSDALMADPADTGLSTLCTAIIVRLQPVDLGARLTMSAQAILGEVSIELRSGDAIVFYADGLSEARHQRVTFRDGELHRALVEARGGSAAQIAATLEGAAVAFSHQGTTDDLAIVVVRRIAPIHLCLCGIPPLLLDFGRGCAMAGGAQDRRFEMGDSGNTEVSLT